MNPPCFPWVITYAVLKLNHLHGWYQRHSFFFFMLFVKALSEHKNSVLCYKCYPQAAVGSNSSAATQGRCLINGLYEGKVIGVKTAPDKR